MLSAPAQKLLRHLQRTNLLPVNSKCLVAISGGGDSAALLCLLHELHSVLRLKIFAVHLNHGLRPEADSDAEFVEKLCADLNIPLYLEKADTAAYARANGFSPEEAGRRLRYRLFRRTLDHFRAQYLATAHTASDQAETLLMRLISGTGLRGLCGIRPRRSFGSCTIIRPLLIFEGHELRSYLRLRRQEWCEDSTNHIPDAPRTKVRLQLLPLLQQWNPRIIDSLNRFSKQVRADEAFLQHCAQTLVDSAQIQDDSTAVPLGVLRRYPSILRKRAYLRWTKKFCSLTSKHLDALEQLALSDADRAHLDLPGQLSADITAQSLVFSPRRSRDAAAPLSPKRIPVQPGCYCFQDYGISLELSHASCSQRPTPSQIYLDPAKIGDALCLRSRRPGDAFYPAGGTGKTKLKKYLNEIKMPQEQRLTHPLLCCGEEIAWIVGHRADQRFLAKPQQQNVWRVTLIEKNAEERRDYD